MRTPSKRGRPHRYVGSARSEDGREQRAAPHPAGAGSLGDAERDRLHELRDRRQIGCDRRNAQHGAAWSDGALAVVLMLGVPGIGMAGIGVIHRVLIRLHRMMLVRGRMFRLNTLMHMRGWPSRTVVTRHDAASPSASATPGASTQNR